MADLPDMTWPGLLAKWTDFARASAAFPKTSEGDRWRASVPGIIALQAVTFALAEVDGLPAEERVVALARAEAVIDRQELALAALWGELGGELALLVGDARAALDAAVERTGKQPGGSP